MQRCIIPPLSRRRVLAAMLAVTTACATATDPGAPVEPEVWRSFAAVRLDSSLVPVLWGIVGADTNYLVSYVIELRVDGTTAFRPAFKVTTRPDTVRNTLLGTYTIVGDSLHIGDVRFGSGDSTLVFPERIGPGRYWLFRVRPSSRAAP